jgi:hypothetical protein
MLLTLRSLWDAGGGGGGGTVDRSQDGVARIMVSASGTQTGRSRVTAALARSQGGISAIRATSERSITGVSHIGPPAPFTSTQTIVGVARIFAERAIKRRVTISIPVAGSN